MTSEIGRAVLAFSRRLRTTCGDKRDVVRAQDLVIGEMSVLKHMLAELEPDSTTPWRRDQPRLGPRVLFVVGASKGTSFEVLRRNLDRFVAGLGVAVADFRSPRARELSTACASLKMRSVLYVDANTMRCLCLTSGVAALFAEGIQQEALSWCYRTKLS